MNGDSWSDGQDTSDKNLVAVVDSDAIQAEKKPLGELASIDDAALADFLTFAWSAPSDWHQLPKSSLALRAIPTVRSAGTTRFEIRCHGCTGAMYRYEYDSRSNVLRYWRDNQVEHSELNPEHGLSNDPLEFALTVAAFIRAAPGSHAPDDIFGTAASLAKDVYTDSSAHGPLQGAVARIVSRMANQWFGPKAFGWGIGRRLGVALAGSGTFFGVFFAYVILDPKSKYEWVRIISSGEDVLPLVPLFVLLAIAGWFAWLVSWKNQSHGPIRLYFGGLLLPYLV
jgi:hypothetical protein